MGKRLFLKWLSIIMIENIIKYEIKKWEYIDFDDISQEDIDTGLLLWASPYWEYVLASELKQKSIWLIMKKYNINRELYNDVWYPKFIQILQLFNLESIKKYMSYTKNFFIKTFWEKPWSTAYNTFLNHHIIWNDLWYENFIKDDIEFREFLEKEVRSLFKYFPKKEFRVWYTLQRLYWFLGNEDFDNGWESTQTLYWLKFKEKGIVKINKQ